MLVEQLQDELVEDRHAIVAVICRCSQACLILEHVEVTAERYQVAFHLSRNFLSLAPGTEAITRTVVTMPALIADYVV